MISKKKTVREREMVPILRIGDREYVERIANRTDVAERPRENAGLSALVLYYERERERSEEARVRTHISHKHTFRFRVREALRKITIIICFDKRKSIQKLLNIYMITLTHTEEEEEEQSI